MSSHKRTGTRISRRQLLNAFGRALALPALLPLAGCFQPLYGQRTLASGEDLLDVLRTIDVEKSDAVTGRFYRNELLFLLRGGKQELPPIYKLEQQLGERVSAISVQVLSDVPQSFILNLSVTYALWHIADNKVVLKGSTFAESSFTFSNQRFTNSRAYLDARERAAKVAADDVRTRLVAFLSKHHG